MNSARADTERLEDAGHDEQLHQEPSEIDVAEQPAVAHRQRIAGARRRELTPSPWIRMDGVDNVSAKQVLARGVDHVQTTVSSAISIR